MQKIIECAAFNAVYPFFINIPRRLNYMWLLDTRQENYYNNIHYLF
jgi:hypothetical protein